MSCWFQTGPTGQPLSCMITTWVLSKRNGWNVGRAVTANLIVRRDMFSRIGLFNSEVLSGGDMEWNDRATAAGEPIVFAADAIVRHPARATLREFAQKVPPYRRGEIAPKCRARCLELYSPIQKLIPSFRTFKKLRKKPDLNLMQALAIWRVQYCLRLVMISETVRLLWFRQADVAKVVGILKSSAWPPRCYGIAWCRCIG